MKQKLKEIAENAKREIEFYKILSTDKNTPKLSKLLIAFAIFYLVSPIDLIPDFIPVIGHVDDLIIIPFLIYIALKLIPQEVIAEARKKAESTLSG